MERTGKPRAGLLDFAQTPPPIPLVYFAFSRFYKIYLLRS
jgi:hypothetical protein